MAYVRYFVLHSCGTFQGRSCLTTSGRVKSAVLAVLRSHVRYRKGSSLFSRAIWIRLNITALPVAPLGVLAKRKFFRSMTKGFILLSARLLDSSSLPSLR